MSDTFDHWEEAAEYIREWELQAAYKRKNFNAAVAAEVKRQLALKTKSNGECEIKQIKAKTQSRGATKQVNCKCYGKPFTARVADLQRGWGKFCSKSCKAKKQEAETGQYAGYISRQLRDL